MATAKKTVKKAVVRNNEMLNQVQHDNTDDMAALPKEVETKEVTETTKLSTEDLILGKKAETVVKTVHNYEDSRIKYLITNLQVNNKPVTVAGDVVETFIGSANLIARKSLREGAKSVITKDQKGNDAYKIEVVE